MKFDIKFDTKLDTKLQRDDYLHYIEHISDPNNELSILVWKVEKKKKTALMNKMPTEVCLDFGMTLLLLLYMATEDKRFD